MSAETITIRVQEVPLVITGEYQPAEPQEECYPGCAESFELESVKTASGDDITALFEYEAGEQIAALALGRIRDEQAGEEAENEAHWRDERRAG